MLLTYSIVLPEEDKYTYTPLVVLLRKVTKIIYYAGRICARKFINTCISFRLVAALIEYKIH